MSNRNFNLIEEKNDEDDIGCCGSPSGLGWRRIRGIRLLRRSDGLLRCDVRVLLLTCT
jgi:hypothetical protein